MANEQFANAPPTTLVGAISAGATSLIVASASGYPSAPFRLIVDQEIFLVTAVSGATFTVTPGYEGTAQAAHANGAAAGHVLTAGVLQGIYPNGRVIVAPGDVTMLATETHIEVANNAATNVYLPSSPIPFKIYTVIDGLKVSATYPISILGSGGYSLPLNGNGWALSSYHNGSNWRSC